MPFFPWKMNSRPDRRPISPGRRILYGVGIVAGITVLAGVFLLYVYFLNYTIPTTSMERGVLAGDRILARRVSFGDGELPPRGIVIAFEYPGDRDQAGPYERQTYMMRCVAVAADTLEVREGQVYVNGARENFSGHVWFQATPRYAPEYDKLRTFPKGMDYTRDNWGPLRIPKKGDVIPVTIDNIGIWKTFIEREGHTVSTSGLRVTVDGAAAGSYTVERDYAFGMGDNRNNSLDSRYWGFIPVENIVGIPFTVYFSRHPESGKIRWDRIFTGIR